jgi:DNA (cytosine-5)-methyltransferase 1
MRYLSVTSGIEAATQAWHPLGWEPVAFSEIEPFPCRVLAHHYPDVPNWGDMTKFKEWPDAKIDVLVGGTPCQSFSVAGVRKGLDDPRGNLMLTYLAIADKYKPTWIVFENVPGLLSSNGGKDFGTFLGGLGQLGYGFAYRVLDAQYVRTDGYPNAVPQRRRRVFVVGHIGSWQRAAAVLFDSESLRGNPPPSRKAGKTITHDVANCIRARGVGTERIGDTRGQDSVVAVSSAGDPHVMATLCATDADKWGSNQWVNEGKAVLVSAISLAGNTIGREPQNGGNGTGFDESGASYTLTKTDVHAVAFSAGNSAGSRSIGYSEEHTPPLRAGASGTNMTPTIACRTNAAGQVNPQGGIAAALNTQTDQCAQILHKNMQVRRLTPTECERLQAFPDNFTNIPGASDSARYKALGNSMAVNVMRVIGQRIQYVEDNT